MPPRRRANCAAPSSRQALWRLFVAAFCVMQVMMMATPSYVAGPGELAPDLAQLLNWGSWVLSAAGAAVLGRARSSAALWRSLRTRRIGMDVPVALGIAVTFVASTGATFDPGGIFGHEVYFDSLTMFVSFLLGARYLELRARHRAAQALESALDSLPETALARGRRRQQRSRSACCACAPGDRVRVRAGPGLSRPTACCSSGHTQVDEALLTGESTPVAKAAGRRAGGRQRQPRRAGDRCA